MSKITNYASFNKIKSDFKKSRKFIHRDLIRYNKGNDNTEIDELMKNGYIQMTEINLELTQVFDSSPITLQYEFDDINEYEKWLCGV